MSSQQPAVMKAYERLYDDKLNVKEVIIVRLDGRAFSKYTKNEIFENPFSQLFADAMKHTAEALLHEFRPTLACVLSDEITLIWKPLTDEDIKCDRHFIFDARKQKLVSLTASLASSTFNHFIHSYSPDIRLATFDSRAFTVPSLVEATENIRWRSCMDAQRNSKTKLGQYHFGSKALHGMSTKLIVEKLKAEKNVIWQDLDDHFKFGTIMHRVKGSSGKLLIPLEAKYFKNDFPLMDLLFPEGNVVF